MIPPTYQQLGARPPAFDQSEPERRTWEAQGCSMSEARPALPVFKRSRSRRESPQGAVSARWREGRPTCRDSSIPEGATACVLEGKGFPLFSFLATHFCPFSFPPMFLLDSLAALALWFQKRHSFFPSFQPHTESNFKRTENVHEQYKEHSYSLNPIHLCQHFGKII